MNSSANYPEGTHRLALHDHPADDAAAEHIEDHVQVQIRPRSRPFELRDVPTPELVGAGGQQLRSCVGRMTELVAPFADRVMGGQQAVERAPVTQIDAFVEQGRIDLTWRTVGKAVAG